MSTSDDIHNTTATGKCPFHQGGHDQSAGGGTTTRDWWPNQLRVDLLNQHSNRSNPLGEDFDYRKEFSKLDYYGLEKRSESPADRISAVVACRLGQLRRSVYSYGLARRGYLPFNRRARRRGSWSATFCTAELLAG